MPESSADQEPNEQTERSLSANGSETLGKDLAHHLPAHENAGALAAPHDSVLPASSAWPLTLEPCWLQLRAGALSVRVAMVP